MKKFLELTLIFITLLAVPCACGDNDKDSPNTPGSSSGNQSQNPNDDGKPIKVTMETLTGVWEGAGSPLNQDDSNLSGWVLASDGWGYDYSGSPDNLINVFYLNTKDRDDGGLTLQFCAGTRMSQTYSMHFAMTATTLTNVDDGIRYKRLNVTPESPLKKFFPGAWTSSTLNADRYVFCQDGSGYTYASRPEIPQTYFKWEFQLGGYYGDSILLMLYAENGKLMKEITMHTFTSEGIELGTPRTLYTKETDFEAPSTSHGTPSEPETPDTPDNPDTPDDPGTPGTPGGNPSVNDPNDPALSVGYWYVNVSKYEDQEYHFYADGTGYQDIDHTVHDMGTSRYWFHWTTSTGSIKLKFDSNTDTQLTYTLSGNLLTLTDSKGKTRQFTHRNSTSILPYGQKPYPNNYIYNKVTERYYMLNRVEEACQHAAPGEKGNWKYLRFFGSDDLLNTTGGYIFYVTPYYEGIDSHWANGTYLMLYNNNYHTYGAVLRTDKSADLSAYKDKLTIKKDGNIHQYDYNGADCEIHFVGKVK